MNERVCVHGAAGSIGSSCVEVITGKHHIILDYGKPLEGEGKVPFEFPKSEKARKNYVVVISHSHADHTGFINAIPADVPVFMSELTRRALLLSNKENITREVNVLRCTEIVELSADVQFVLFPMNHSAPDACGVLIGTDDKVIFYTGDFRAHGYGGGERFVWDFKKYLSSVRFFANKPLVLISEASNACRTENEQISESGLSMRFAQNFVIPGLVMIKMSNQNIERIATILSAVRTTDRILVTEPYTALCAKELSNYFESPFNCNYKVYNLRPDGENWRVFNIQSKKTEEIASDGKLYQFGGKYKITKEELENNRDKIVFIANVGSESYLEKKGLVDRVVWSMWTGYSEYEELKKKYNVSVIHSSGHIYPLDWFEIIKGFAPNKTILVHTEYPQEAAELIKVITKPIVAEKNKEINL